MGISLSSTTFLVDEKYVKGLRSKKHQVTSSCICNESRSLGWYWNSSPISFSTFPARVITWNGSLIAFKCIFCYSNKLLYWIPNTEQAVDRQCSGSQFQRFSLRITARISAILAEILRVFPQFPVNLWGSIRLSHVRFLPNRVPILPAYIIATQISYFQRRNMIPRT